MSGLWGTLSIALGALQADQAGIEVTSNNISNINTPGYTRQRVDLSEETPITVGQQVFGTGVQVDKIESVRDDVLELRIADETQQQSQSSSYLGAMQQVETMFNDAQGTGLQKVISNFFDSFSELSTDPTSTSLRQGVLTAAQNMASAFNSTAANLNQIQTSLDQQVTADVSQVNNLSSQIANLNGQISQVPGGNNGAGALIDQRTQLVQQLAAITNVAVTNVSDGEINVSTGNGTALVAGQQNFALGAQVDATSGHQHVYDAQGTDITSELSGGDLAGIVQARDQGITGVLSNLDTLASGIANAVNNQQTQGSVLNPNGEIGDPGGNMFNTPPATGAAAAMTVTMTDPNLIAAAGLGEASGDNTNSTALADLQDSTVVSGETPIDYYSSLVSGLGNEISGATADNSAQQLVLTQLQQQRNSVSGVSLDEEAVNLIQFQQAYSASARVVSTVNSMFSTLLSMGAS